MEEGEHRFFNVDTKRNWSSPHYMSVVLLK